MRFFYVVIVPLIWEGVNVLPSPVMMRKNEIQIGFVTPPKKAERREMANVKRPSSDLVENFLESVVVAIDTGNIGKVDSVANAKKAAVVENFVKSLGSLVKNSVRIPDYRAKAKEYDIKPELVHIRGEKPSLMLNVNSETVINGLRDILKSKLAHRMVEKLSEEASFLFPLVDE